MKNVGSLKEALVRLRSSDDMQRRDLRKLTEDGHDSVNIMQGFRVLVRE